MQNKFGFKDFLMLVLLLAVLVGIFVSMRQDDRRFEQMQEVIGSNKQQYDTLIQIRDGYERFSEEQTEAIRTAVRAEVLRLSAQIDRLGEASGGAVEVAEATPTIDAEGRDTSWARPGVPVTWPEPYQFPDDPRDEPDFATGGEFVEFFEAQVPKITPYLYSDVYGRRIVDGRVCESLGRYDPVTLRPVGLLAEAWQYDPNGMWLRAKIHDRARFSDGEPVTAEDFRWTFHEIVFNQQIEAARFRSTLNVIDEVVAIDDKVVEFRFVKPQFTNFDQAITQFWPLPKHFYEQFQPSQINEATSLLMGCGPYRLDWSFDIDDQWTAGDDIVLVRNENYWRDQRPSIDRLRFRVISNNVGRLTAFTNGDGDMMRATSEQYRTKTREPAFLEANHAAQWINMRSGFGFIAWNCGERQGKLTPFHDKRVRRAMTHLIDRDRVLRDFAEGLGQVATGPFPPVSEQSNPAIEPWPFDIEEAKRLLDEAGWRDRNGDGILENEAGEDFRWEYTISKSSTFSEKLAQYLKDQCARIGIECTIRKIDWAIFSTTLNRRDFDAITMQWSNSAPESDPYQLWHSDSIPDQGDNFTQWSNERADELIERGRATLDYDERMAVWHELHEVLHDEQPYTFMLNSPWIRFISRRVGNVNTYPIGLDINEMYIPAPL